MPAKTFTKTVIIPKRNEEGEVMTDTGKPDGIPLVDRTLGDFTFRLPTFQERKDIQVRYGADFAHFPDANQVPITIYFNIMAAAYLPYQVTSAPQGFDWTALTDEDARALMQAYWNGEAETSGAKN